MTDFITFGVYFAFYVCLMFIQNQIVKTTLKIGDTFLVVILLYYYFIVFLDDFCVNLINYSILLFTIVLFQLKDH